MGEERELRNGDFSGVCTVVVKPSSGTSWKLILDPTNKKTTYNGNAVDLTECIVGESIHDHRSKDCDPGNTNLASVNSLCSGKHC